MDSLNKYLFAVLSALLVVGGIGSVLASSDDGYGVIEMVDDDSVEDSDDVISVSEESDNSSSEGTHISLSRHSTGYPLMLLVGALVIGGYSIRRRL